MSSENTWDKKQQLFMQKNLKAFKKGIYQKSTAYSIPS